MASRSSATSHFRFLLSLLILFASNLPVADALTQSLCSTQNTGADSQLMSDNYQSNGKCFDTCKANYAFAVVQGKNCWCSNFAPADTTSTGSCNTPCPGYPFEQCGSSGFFGYIPLNKAPLGTLGASSQSQSSTSSPLQLATSSSQVTPSTNLETTTETTTTSTPAHLSTHYVPVPVRVTTTPSPPPSPPSTTSSTPTTSSLESSSSSESTWTPTPITSVMTVTGQVTTITITPTAPPSAAAAAQSDNGGFMSHPGKVAGLFVGVALIICLIAAALICFFLRRKRDSEAETLASIAGGETPQRRQSKLSTMGLLGGTRRSNKRKSVPAIQTSGWGPGNGTEKSPSDTPIDYHRASYPRVVDQRLEPTALWNPLQDNGSHVSIQSFRDDQDYSRRMLRIANPDDRPHSRE
ncbi:MAG: hypothetical protein Q9201_006745 [Fulgogasparrea decipioides]